MKLECMHVDTCLADYWSGHHLPHVQIDVFPGMTLSQIKESIKNELSQGAVAGSNHTAWLLSCDYFVHEKDQKAAEKAFRAAIASVNRIKPAVKYKKRFFTELVPDCDGVCAFFVFDEATTDRQPRYSNHITH